MRVFSNAHPFWRAGNLVVLVASLLVVGCESDYRYDVSGGANFEGVPIETGDIVFSPTTPGSSNIASAIEAGHFSATLPPGTYTVRISANRPTGRTMPGMYGDTVAETMQYIPAQFNDASTLQVTIGPETELPLAFELR